MSIRNRFFPALVLMAATLAIAQQSSNRNTPKARPQGPCDIYGAAHTPCVAAHSTTRALYASYKGPLYQIKRQSDGKTLDIGIVSPAASDAGGYADATAQDSFCANTLCVINLIYDQSGKGNHLYQAAPGTFKGPGKGAFDTQPIADMAPITISGHKAYGVYMIPGMGFRNNNAAGMAVNDEPEGIYYVVDGTHYDSGCCFDYGNSSTNGRAVGTGTMETTYFGTSTAWGRGNGPGPWIMSDMEAGLFSGQGPKQNAGDPTIGSWRFVTAVMDGGGGNRWDIRGGNAQKGNLKTFYSGVRPSPGRSGGYYPMRKQGGILLGTGGDNGNGSSGTFYEGVMTNGYPTEATTDAVQANILTARYDVQRLNLSRVTTFTPKSTQDVTATFTNTTGAPVSGIQMSLSLPSSQWTSIVSGSNKSSEIFTDSVAPGASVSTTFKVTSPSATGAGFLIGKAEWADSTARGKASDTITARLRNVWPVRINEVRFGTSSNSTDQFIELYNSSDKSINVSNWTLTHTPSQWSSISLATIPSGTKLQSHAFYLLGLSNSGLAAPATPGAKMINVRTTTGFAVGQVIDIDGETRTIASVGTPAEAMTTLFIPVSTGPWLTIPAGSTNLPVTNTTGFEAGQKIGIDIGGSYELSTVSTVGKPATQTILSVSAGAGARTIKLAATASISVGDTLTVDTGGFKELVKVTRVGTAGETGSGIDVASPLHFNHRVSVDVSDPGTGITFSPATKFPHTSGEAVQALGSGITLDKALAHAHAYGAAVLTKQVRGIGYAGLPIPDQWFGAMLSNTAGSLALMDATGTVVVDAVVYGSQQSNSSGNGTIASPELATLEGEQDKGGCIVVTPRTVSGSGVSAGRFPDGADTDNNCTDFLTQAAATLAASSVAGADNIKVANVASFGAGQTVIIDSDSSQEAAVVSAVGTAGATTVATATEAGAKIVPVANVFGFTPGQILTIDSGVNSETATVAMIARRGVPAITFATALTHAHLPGAQISGTGLTLATKLKQAHASGVPVVTDVPTPGAPNKYYRPGNR